MRRSSSATIRSCAASRSRSADPRERGVVAAASYEARKFGVRSAMPSVTAQAPMPRPDLREAALRGLQGDLPADPRDLRRAHADHRAAVARRGLSRRDRKPARASPWRATSRLRIRAKIKAETGLNASAGISYNKFLAKLASDHRKPNGQFVITPEMGPGFVEALPVGKFHGIGPATGAKMNALGILTGLDHSQPDARRSCKRISARLAPTTTGSRAASTSGPSGPTGSASRSVPRTRSRAT